jgi:hypothetical protein
VKTRIVIACLLTIGVALLLTFGGSSPVDHAEFLRGAHVDSRVRSALLQSCGDCHSDSTRYPWYTWLPWISEVVQDDVQRGREQLNLSHWSQYSRLRQQRALTGIANQVKDRLMPLPEYLVLHPLARLSDQEVNAIFDWAQRERLRLIVEGAR